MATGENMILHVATYDGTAAAAEDFGVIKDEQSSGELHVIGAVVMTRDEEGEVEVTEHHTGLVGGGATTGGVIGLVVGLFSPPLLLSTVVGAGIGAGIGGLLKRSEEKEIGEQLRDYLPPGSSAILAVVEDDYADRIDKAITKSAKKVSRAIDKGDYDKLAKELDNAGYRIGGAIES